MADKNIQLKISKVKEDFLKAFFAVDDPTPYIQQNADNFINNLIKNKYKVAKTLDEMAEELTDEITTKK